jgi:hypothetical protein
MSDQKYDSVLVGYAEEPRRDESGNILAWTVRLKDHEMKEMVDKYATSRNDKGHGGNVYLTMFMSKNGKPCCRVYDPNSEAAKERRAEKQSAAATNDLPF